jgi:pyrroloquinoline quinone biosynthesis protein E
MSEMSLEKILEVLHQTRELGGSKVDITGGEPTLRDDYLKIIKGAKEMGYQVELVTNSLRLDHSTLKTLHSLDLDSLAVSLDGYTWQTHGLIRNTSSEEFEKVVRNISDAVNLGIKTKINTLACQENMEEIPRIIQLGEEKGVKEVGLYYFTPVGRGAHQNLHSVEPLTWLRFVRERLDREYTLKVSLEIPLIEKELYSPKMGCIWDVDPFHLQILPEGKTYPCAIMASYHLPIGNLYHQNISEIWKDESVWSRYHSQLEGHFNRNKGGCVAFRDFDLKDYPGYSFVCPLRKYSPQEVRR